MPSTKLHQAIIVSHRPAGGEYYRIELKASGITAGVKPGQFVMLRVSENWDPLLARPFGIASLPSRSSLELYYRVVGRGTSLLTMVKKGHVLSLTGPIGNGFPAPARGSMPVLVAGGSGFPPLHYFAQRYGHGTQVIIGARNADCLPPSNIIKGFRDRAVKVHIATEDGSRGVRGTTTDVLDDLLTTIDRPSRPVIYACGPHAMMAAVSRVAVRHGVTCYVSLEERMACGVGACMGCAVAMKAGGYKRVCKEGPVFDAREIDWAEQILVRIKKQ